MRKLTLLFFCFILFEQLGCSQLRQTEGSRIDRPVRVASYNIRYENNHDGDNSWSNRKESVKSLIHFHDFDIFGIQEGVINQVRGIAELEPYRWIGKGRDDGKEAGEHCAIFYKKERFNWPPYGPEGTTNGFKLDGPLKSRIDYIFVNNPVKVIKYGVLSDFQDQRFPSDYLPVVALVKIV